MSELFASPYFGVGLSVIAFGIGVKLNRKLKTPVCNPLIADRCDRDRLGRAADLRDPI